MRAFKVAHNYITYRFRRALVRKSNSTDEQILSLLECNNEEVKQENSNKNPTVNSVQRDYMAGEVSKDITKRFLLTPDIVEAHEKGIGPRALSRLTGVPYSIVQRATSAENEKRLLSGMVCESTLEDEDWYSYCSPDEFEPYPEY